MITLYQFHRIWGLPNSSSFCMKLETYLRMMQLPYENKFVHNPQKSPKHKLPHIKMDGFFYADSELIIDKLKIRFGDVLDKDLTAEQHALAVLLDIACSERLYWVSVYMRWQYEKGWDQVKNTMFGKLTKFSKLYVPNLFRKFMLKQLHEQGMGRHSFEEVTQLGIKTLDALAVILATNDYFLGDKATSIDATTFAFLANIIWAPLHDPVKVHILKQENIMLYCHRMWDKYYPDLPKPEMLRA